MFSTRNQGNSSIQRPGSSMLKRSHSTSQSAKQSPKQSTVPTLMQSPMQRPIQGPMQRSGSQRSGQHPSNRVRESSNHLTIPRGKHAQLSRSSTLSRNTSINRGSSVRTEPLRYDDGRSRKLSNPATSASQYNGRRSPVRTGFDNIYYDPNEASSDFGDRVQSNLRTIHSSIDGKKIFNDIRNAPPGRRMTIQQIDHHGAHMYPVLPPQDREHGLNARYMTESDKARAFSRAHMQEVPSGKFTKLVPSSGSDAYVRWNPNSSVTLDPNTSSMTYDASGRNAHVLLAHEMIHGSNAMNGRMHPDPNQEEYKTTGLGEHRYSGCPSENTYRSAQGMDERTFYSANSKTFNDGRDSDYQNDQRTYRY